MDEKQKQRNLKYLLKCDSITIRPPMGKGQAYRAAAAREGKSVSKYIYDALDEYAKGGPVYADADQERVRLSVSLRAMQALAKDGESATDTASRLFMLGVESEKACADAAKTAGKTTKDYLLALVQAAKTLQQIGMPGNQ